MNTNHNQEQQLTDTTSSVDDFLDEGSGPPAAKFANVGDVVKGDIIAARVGVQRKFGTGEIDTWDDGTPKRQLQIDLRTDDGDVRLYCKPTLKEAISDAVKAVGGRLSDGGTLTAKRVEDGEPPKPGFNPRQLFKAKFEPKPATSGDVDSLDDF